MDQRKRKLIFGIHPRDDRNRLYVSRGEGGRGLTSIEDSVDTSIQWLEDYIEKHEGGLITATRNDTDNTKTNRRSIRLDMTGLALIHWEMCKKFKWPYKQMVYAQPSICPREWYT